MIGPILVFLSVCALVTVFMLVAHSFLRAATEPEDGIPQTRAPKTDEPSETDAETAERPQWAH